MSERLQKAVNDALIRKGIAELRDGSGLAEKTIREIADGSRKPHRNSAYKLALACGFSDSEALDIGYECLPDKAKRTA